MPPKSLQPSAVGGKQTPGWVFKPQQDACLVPRETARTAGRCAYTDGD